MCLVVRRSSGTGLQVEKLERRDGPLRLGERHLQVEKRGVVVGVRRYLLQLNRDSGVLRLLGEERRRLDEARENRRGSQEHRQVLLAGLLEQALGLIDVLLALRQRVVIEGKALADDVVSNRAETVDRIVDERLAVGDEPDRLPDAIVGERR